MFKNPIPYYHSKEFHLTLRDIVDNVKTGFGGQLEVSTSFWSCSSESQAALYNGCHGLFKFRCIEGIFKSILEYLQSC